MKITILGNNSALPAYGRFPTAQVIELGGQLMLMDCGEGTQMRMQQFGVRSARIHHIFISHAHGDHYFGLIGFISSLALLGRTAPLYVYCPASVKHAIDCQLDWDTGFLIHYHLLEEGMRGLLLDEEKYAVACFPVYHSIPTLGFLFTERKRKRVLNPAKVQEYEVPKYYYPKLTAGDDYISRTGDVVKNEWVTEPGLPEKRYAFCADTRYAPEIVDDIKGVDVLYHESTYLEASKEKAQLRMHATAKEAGEIARLAGVKRLWLGHFSSKYKDLSPFLEEARQEFHEVELAIEGQSIEL